MSDSPYDDRTKRLAVELYPSFALLMLDAYDRTFTATAKRMSMVEGTRTFGRQAELFSQGRTKPGPNAGKKGHPELGDIVTKAQAGKTIHNYGLAADSCFKAGDGYTDMPWEAFDKACDDVGLKTGAAFKKLGDKDHAEQTWGLQLAELLLLWQRGGYDFVYARVDALRTNDGKWAIKPWKEELVVLKNRLGVLDA